MDGKGGPGFGPMAAMGKGGMGRAAPYPAGPMNSGGPVEQNEVGLPIRPDMEDCLLYLNTGFCKNGMDCIFNHPRNSGKGGMKGGCAPVMQPPGGGPPGLDGGGKGMLGGKGPLPPGPAPMGMPPAPKEGGAPPPGMPPMGMPPAGDNNSGPSDDAQAQEWKEPVKVEYNEAGLPIRPGAQRCGFWLRSGNCQFGSGCRFDHPAGLGGLMAGSGGIGSVPFSLLLGRAGPKEGELARRPGRDQCPFLSRTGNCPFGAECRFDHATTTEGESAPAPKPAPAAKDAVKKQKEVGLGGVKGRRPTVQRRMAP